MQMSEYLVQSARTCSDKPLGESKVTPSQLSAVLTMCGDALQVLDAIKKHIFYGKPLPDNFDEEVARIEELDNGYGFHQDHIHTDLLHAILGIGTEAGELLDALDIAIRTGKPIDPVNLKEENGDLLWYQALALRTRGSTFEEDASANIAKLRIRFPEKFTPQLAIDRNVDAELSVI